MRLSADAIAANPKLAAMVRAAEARDVAQRAPATTPAQTFRNEAELHRAILGMALSECDPGTIVFHVPNGGKRPKLEAVKLSGLGVMAGLPDLIVLHGGRAFGIEIKTESGRLSGDQKKMAERFRRAGSEYEIARTVEAARLLLRQWGVIAVPQSNRRS